MKRSDIKNYEKRRRQIQAEEQEKRNMQRAVNLEQLAQMKQLQENQQRANMYSFAGNIVVANSKLTLPADATGIAAISKESLVMHSLALSQEYFKQLNELDEKLNKEQEAKLNGESNVSGKIIAG